MYQILSAKGNFDHFFWGFVQTRPNTSTNLLHLLLSRGFSLLHLTHIFHHHGLGHSFLWQARRLTESRFSCSKEGIFHSLFCRWIFDKWLPVYSSCVCRWSRVLVLPCLDCQCSICNSLSFFATWSLSHMQSQLLELPFSHLGGVSIQLSV